MNKPVCWFEICVAAGGVIDAGATKTPHCAALVFGALRTDLRVSGTGTHWVSACSLNNRSLFS